MRDAISIQISNLYHSHLRQELIESLQQVQGIIRVDIKQEGNHSLLITFDASLVTESEILLRLKEQGAHVVGSRLEGGERRQYALFFAGFFGVSSLLLWLLGAMLHRFFHITSAWVVLLFVLGWILFGSIHRHLSRQFARFSVPMADRQTVSFGYYLWVNGGLFFTLLYLQPQLFSFAMLTSYMGLIFWAYAITLGTLHYRMLLPYFFADKSHNAFAQWRDSFVFADTEKKSTMLLQAGDRFSLKRGMLLPVKARLLSEEAELEHLYGREHVTHHYRCGEGLCAGGISKSDLVYFEALSGLNEPSFHGEITPIVPWRSGISWLSVMFAYLGQSFLFFLLAMLVVGFSYASIVPWYWSLSMWFRTGVLALFWGTLTHQSWENFTRTRLRRLFDRWSWGGGALWVRHRRLTGIAQIKTLVIHQGRFGLDLAMAQASITVTNSTMASTFSSLAEDFLLQHHTKSPLPYQEGRWGALSYRVEAQSTITQSAGGCYYRFSSDNADLGYIYIPYMLNTELRSLITLAKQEKFEVVLISALAQGYLNDLCRDVGVLHAYGGCDISQIDQLLATFQRKAERVIYLSDGRSLAHEDNIKDAPIWLADERADMPTLKRSEVIFGAIETKSIMRWIALAQLFDRLTRTRAKSYHLFFILLPVLTSLVFIHWLDLSAWTILGVSTLNYLVFWAFMAMNNLKFMIKYAKTTDE